MEINTINREITETNHFASLFISGTIFSSSPLRLIASYELELQAYYGDLAEVDLTTTQPRVYKQVVEKLAELHCLILKMKTLHTA